jgi:hypothetical protein
MLMRIELLQTNCLTKCSDGSDQPGQQRTQMSSVPSMGMKRRRVSVTLLSVACSAYCRVLPTVFGSSLTPPTATSLPGTRTATAVSLAAGEPAALVATFFGVTLNDGGRLKPARCSQARCSALLPRMQLPCKSV